MAKAFSSFQAFALEQLGCFRPLTARRMFGGVGACDDGPAMSCRQVPADDLEDPAARATWLSAALGVARAARRTRAAKPRGR
jgi:TfoX/Sxy family transcriptional regulator of competence genes